MKYTAKIENHYAYIYDENGVFLRNYPLSKDSRYPDEHEIMYAVRGIDWWLENKRKAIARIERYINQQENVKAALLEAMKNEM